MFLSIIGIVIGWFVAGFLINLLVYGGKPQHEMGKSSTAKILHMIINILTLIALISIIFR